MEVSQFIFTFLLLTLHANAFIITHMIDYRDFDEKCIVQYVKCGHRQVKQQCKCDIRKYVRSFYESIEEILRYQNEAILECAVNQLKVYNVSEVFLKAIAYNYNPNHFVTFESAEKSCDNIIKFNNNNTVFTEGCGYRVMVVILRASNKSLGKLRHCLNDLFREYQLDKIILYNYDDEVTDEIGLRSFGKHAITFLEQLAKIATNICESYEDLGSQQVDAMRKFLSSSNNDDFYETTTIDLFGFTQPSMNVERCIINNYRNFNYANSNIDERNLKEFNKIVLSCLKFF